MSPEQFPSGPHDVVKFSTLNLLEPVPEHLQATFDVLHLRLLVLGLPTGTWELACQNILSLLKPGGWVQWEEGDFKYETLALNRTYHFRERCADHNPQFDESTPRCTRSQHLCGSRILQQTRCRRANAQPRC